jgi:hypothetical protein
VALPKGRATPSAVRAVWGVNGHRDPLLIDARPAELERNLVTSNLDQRSCSTLSLSATDESQVGLRFMGCGGIVWLGVSD